MTFGREFTQAVEAKQVGARHPPCCLYVAPKFPALAAQQDAERQRFVVEKAEQEKLAAVIRAEGESEAAKLISGALQKSGQGLIELRRIEAAREIAATLAASRNVTYLPNGGGQNIMLKI